jgi:hypothetical protein
VTDTLSPEEPTDAQDEVVDMPKAAEGMSVPGGILEASALCLGRKPSLTLPDRPDARSGSGRLQVSLAAFVTAALVFHLS